MNSRDELIKELDKLILRSDTRFTELVADFILIDRKYIVEPLVKLNMSMAKVRYFEGILLPLEIGFAIDETLTRALGEE